MKQLLTALSDLHALGIMHRDIKTDNILIREPNDELVLCDFGMSKLVSDPQNHRGSAWVGTPALQAPELVLKSEKYDFSIDIWGAGVVLYEMLTCDVFI